MLQTVQVAQVQGDSNNYSIEKEVFQGLLEHLDIDAGDKHSFLTTYKYFEQEDLFDLCEQFGIEFNEIEVFEREQDWEGNWHDVVLAAYEAFAGSKKIVREANSKDDAIDCALWFICENYSLGHILEVMTQIREGN